MAKTKANNLLPLFNHLSDADQISGFKTKDEREYEDAKKKKSRAKKLISISPAPSTGPACLRCKAWIRPVDDDPFGMCRVLGVAESPSILGSFDKGDIVPRVEAQHTHRVATELLRTREAFQCSAFEGFEEVAA